MDRTSGADPVSCSCGATLPRTDSTATHRYIRSTRECWAAFGVVLAREYEDPALFAAVHQLTVDAYAAQHPVEQPAKSLCTHLVSLAATMENGRSGPGVLKAFVASRRDYPDLEPPAALGSLTIADVAAAATAEEHRDLVRRWAHEVWTAWSGQHAAIAALVAP